ncbi:MAG TPA: LytTR family DNA-binding domain-containing protein [Fulvivirga sp.]|nr:LytTR family DNA-binding domain-containing protein [Fulvivirga sp.]
MKCVAIDDEENALKVIKLYADKIEEINLIGVFTDPVKGIAFIEKNRVDLLFLDINMQNLNGFELLETLSYQPKVVFTTAYSEYAVKSYNVDALDYLVKPITFGRFLKAVHKAENASQKVVTSIEEAVSEKIISVKSGTSIHRIKLSDILYLEAQGNYTSYVTVKGKILVLCTMKEALAKLDDRFVQTHRSFVVAVDKVSKVESHQLAIENKGIPLSSSYRKTVLQYFQ